MAIWPAVRESLDAANESREAVMLPGDDLVPFEGALTVSRADDGSWAVSTVDYGQPRSLRRAASERDIAEALLGYIRMALPPLQSMDPAERERLLASAAPHLLDLAARAQNGLLIDVPPGILFDRLGSLDGFHLYPQGTGFEARSLPPNVIAQPLRRFVTAGSIRMNVSLTPAWFGRPGGGLRFTVNDPTAGIRDLVAAGALRRVSWE